VFLLSEHPQKRLLGQDRFLEPSLNPRFFFCHRFVMEAGNEVGVRVERAGLPPAQALNFCGGWCCWECAYLSARRGCAGTRGLAAALRTDPGSFQQLAVGCVAGELCLHLVRSWGGRGGSQIGAGAGAACGSSEEEEEAEAVRHAWDCVAGARDGCFS